MGLERGLRLCLLFWPSHSLADGLTDILNLQCTAIYDLKSASTLAPRSLALYIANSYLDFDSRPPLISVETK